MASWLIAVVVIFGFLSAPSRPSAAAAGKQVVIAHAAMNARVAPLWVARERGFFAKYGVEADTIFGRGAPSLVAAMQSNEIDVGYTGGTTVVGGVANGPELKEKLLAQGALPSGNTPQAFAAHIDAELKKWQPVVKASGAKVD